jgi:hypothetical protein
LALTALGVDYVESNSSSIPVLHKLLESGIVATPGSRPATGGEKPASADAVLLSTPDEDAG